MPIEPKEGSPDYKFVKYKKDILEYKNENLLKKAFERCLEDYPEWESPPEKL